MRKLLDNRVGLAGQRVYRRLGRLRGPVAKDFSVLRNRVADFVDPDSALRVLLVSSNGAGLGHLSRLNALSKHMQGQVLFYTMSSAYHRLDKNSNEIIYFPSYGDLGMEGQKWNPLMEAHFSAVVKGYQPTAIVFDGTYVYTGVSKVARKLSIPLIWVQRGCWKESVAVRSSQKNYPERYVDMVIVPGDYGCQESLLESAVPVEAVPPIVTVDRSDLLPRDTAIAELGLPAGKKYFLVQVGAGVINDTKDTIEIAVRAIQSLGEEWIPVLVRNPLKRDNKAAAVHSVEVFPLGRYLKAFDAGVFAAGYNTVQEAVAAMLPAVFVPNVKTKTDDQEKRASGLAARELGLVANNSEELVSAIKLLGDPEVRSHISEQLKRVYKSNGAERAAFLVEDFSMRTR